MELTGPWVAAPADDELRRAYPQPDFDDRGWSPVTVPGQWQAEARFADNDGPLLHRLRFEADPAEDGRRAWLIFDGIFYEADVWLDGDYVGATEGYFQPHAFDVTQHLRGGREHVLAAEVSCRPPRDLTAKQALTGVFQHWDCLDPDDNPGGIWRAVRLEETGPVRISRLRVLCADATTERAVLHVRAVLDAAEPGPVQLRTTVGEAAEHHRDITLATGENRIEWRVSVDQPRLWWPRSLGEQPLYGVEVTVTAPGRAAESDRRALSTGLRHVAMRDWIFSVNGERLFLKGANQGPIRPRLSEASDRCVDRVVELAQEAGLDFLRVHGHIGPPRLYEAADRAGLLLWQDLPLQWGYARRVRKEAARQAREAVDLLGHHPSVLLWCGHNEPLALDLEPGRPVDVVRTGLRALALQQLPTWNKTVIDRGVRRALTKADATRPVVAHSGVWPGLVAAGTDSHLYFGWYWGDIHDFPAFCARWPRQVRFVGEFGAQAVPDEAGFMEPDRWPDLDWEALARHRSLQRQFFAAQGLDPSRFPTFDEWRAATQAHQAQLIKVHVEALRRLKYRPTGGFALFALADAHPAVTWSVLDHQHRPKPGYVALRAACAPVIVVAGPLAPAYPAGTAVRCPIHVVNDTHAPREGATVAAELHCPGGAEQRWSWTGDIAADDCTYIATVDLDLGPDPGPVRVDLTLTAADGAPIAANTHHSAVFSS